MGRQTERGGRLSERRDGTWFFKYGCHISRRTKRKEGRTNERDAERIGDRDRERRGKAPLEQTSFFLSMPAAVSDSRPTLYVVSP